MGLPDAEVGKDGKVPCTTGRGALEVLLEGKHMLMEHINAGSPVMDRAEDAPYLAAPTPATFSYRVPSLSLAVASEAVSQ